MSQKSENCFKDNIASFNATPIAKAVLKLAGPCEWPVWACVCWWAIEDLDWGSIFDYFLSSFVMTTFRTTIKKNTDRYPNPHRTAEHHDAPTFRPPHMKKIIG